MMLTGRRACVRCGVALAVCCVAADAFGDAAGAAEPEATEGVGVGRSVLCGKWAFAYTPKALEKPPTESAFLAEMPVPGCWDDHVNQGRARSLWPEACFNPVPDLTYPMDRKPPDAALPYLLGVGWYRRPLEVPSDWRGKQITLHVGRVVMRARVFVNGKAMHTHVGHSTTWEVSLEEHLRYGKPNELIIAVDNTDTSRLGCIIRGYKGRSGGIYGPVSISVAGSARIEDLYVYEGESGKLRWRVELEGQLPDDARLTWCVTEPGNGRALGGGHVSPEGHVVEWRSSTFDLRRWSDVDPVLYDVRVTLQAGDALLDACRQPFGLRRVRTDGYRILLNGTPTYFHGICECSYYPKTCTPPTDVAWYRRHLETMKAAGFNWVRFHTSVPLEPYLQAADEVGMLIQVEPPRGYAREQWRDILRFCRNHPSVVIYCCGNEEVLDEEKIAFLEQCREEQRRHAPNALFNPQEALRGIEYGSAKQMGEGVVAKPFRHNPSRLAKLKAFSDVFGQYAQGTLSYRTLAGDPRVLDDRLRLYERPCLTHEVGIIGCFLDVSLEQRYRGTRIGPGLFANIRENLKAAGLLARAKTYYENSCAWQRLLMKDVIETTRLTSRITGYDLLGANDPHWHRNGYGCGMLNEFDELKPGDSLEHIGGYNARSVVLIEKRRRRNLAMGERFVTPVHVSWFEARPLETGRLTWRLLGSDGSALRTGAAAVSRVACGHVGRIAEIAFDAPVSSGPRRVILEVCLEATGVSLVNRWPFWLFPSAEAKAREGVRVVSSLDASAAAGLLRGDRVVLLGHKPLPARGTSFQMAIAGRPEGNLATVIEDHPLMRRFPHDGFCSWQFAPMLNGGAAVQFNAMPELFDPIVEVVNTYKRIRKQAGVFEWRVGKGRLLVCSLKLPRSDPGAEYLRACLRDYAASDAFRPGTRVSAERFARLTKLPVAGPQAPPKTDEAGDPRVQKR